MIKQIKNLFFCEIQLSFYICSAKKKQYEFRIELGEMTDILEEFS